MGKATALPRRSLSSGTPTGASPAVSDETRNITNVGSGKSTVGEALARRLEWRFLDFDVEIERREGTTVSSSGCRPMSRVGMATCTSPTRCGAFGRSAIADRLSRRLLLIIPTLVIILLVNFVIVQAAPGGPVEQAIAHLQGIGGASVGGSGNEMAGSSRASRGLDPQLIKDIEKQYGFDKPAHERLLAEDPAEQEQAGRRWTDEQGGGFGAGGFFGIVQIRRVVHVAQQDDIARPGLFQFLDDALHVIRLLAKPHDIRPQRAATLTGGELGIGQGHTGMRQGVGRVFRDRLLERGLDRDDLDRLHLQEHADVDHDDRPDEQLEDDEEADHRWAMRIQSFCRSASKSARGRLRAAGLAITTMSQAGNRACASRKLARICRLRRLRSTASAACLREMARPSPMTVQIAI